MPDPELDLQRLDLNLLVAFGALVSEVSVTRAAQHMGVTQSAMSHTLRRLRAAFGDPLLVRSGGRMVLTPRAEQLRGPIEHGLATLQRALVEPEPFDPASSRREFSLAGPDLFELLFAPGLLRALGSAGGRLSLRCLRPRPRWDLAALESGELDVSITARLLDDAAPLEPPPGPELMRRTLLIDDWSCFVRRDHPALGKRRRKLSLSAYLAATHAVVSPTGRGEGVVDLALAELGERRTVGLRVPHFYSAPVAIARTDLVLTAPSSLVDVLGEGHLGLVRLAPPIELPRHAIDASWHPRVHADASHQWFRAQLVEVTRCARPRRRQRRA